MQAMILVEDPYYNEPAHSATKGTDTGASSAAAYNAELTLNVSRAVRPWGCVCVCERERERESRVGSVCLFVCVCVCVCTRGLFALRVSLRALCVPGR